ncbi:MAG: HD domain-containing protein [Zoogloeaceae bacterium]|nr:HD domain-containing protein [Zoogloeaceae bacterium]MCK6385482.1 HD domain-containing protein [Rhodocyclaceae bacterium]
MTERYDEHYIASVTALGDTHEVVATQAVFTRNGIKLIERGARINSAFREKLVRHKLLPPIDQCLAVADGVTQTGVREYAREILDAEPRYQLMRSALPGIERLRNAFYAMPLTPALAFKLTVAREQRPEIYGHSVQMALIALFLAIKSRLPDRDLATVAAAGMLHDLGELHIDPELLRPGRRIEAAELRHVYAHPMTAYLILQEHPQYHPEISTAVFEHHERLDGSGYPRGLKGEEIGPVGRILMLAEAVTTLFEKSWRTHGASRLSVMLKMNRRKFDRELIDHLVGLLRGGEPQGLDSQGEVSAEAVVAQLDQLAEIFRNWHGAYQACAVDTPQVAEAPLVGFVNERITGLERTLLEAGFHPDELAALTAGIEDDAVALAEMQLMVRESRWQVSDIINEVVRRGAELEADAAGRALVEGWIKRTEGLLQG